MIGLNLYLPESFRYRDAIFPEKPSLGDPVQIPHESTRVVSELVGTFLELVQFLDHSDRDHYVIILELAYSFVVVEDDVGVQDKNLGLPVARPHFRDPCVPCHI